MAQVEQSLLQLLSRELAAISVHHRQLLVSVSGGRDSVCLLHALQSLRSKFDLDLSVLHVNFRLRGKDSDADQAFVEKLCKGFQVPCFIHRVSRARKLTQEEAREIRLNAAAKLLPQAILVEAHHADDQVETFFFRLLRGTGLSGLKGMLNFSERQGRKVYRPLLQTTRAQIDAYVKSRKLSFQEDRTNAEDHYSRNWIRNKLTPKFDKKFPSFRDSVMRVQSQIQEEEEYFEAECQRIEELVLLNDFFKISELQKLHKAILRRFLHFVFKKYYSVILDRSQILELTQLVLWDKPFSWNAPQNWVVRAGKDGSLRVFKAPGRSAAKSRPKPLKKQAKG